MHIRTRLSVLALAAAACTPALAAEGYALWDDFNAVSQINLSKWLASDRQRLVQNGQLRVLQRDRGSQTANSGMFNNGWGQDLKNPAAITQMRAVVTVAGFSVTGCPDNNGEPSDVQARMFGEFFNAGIGGNPNNRIDDIGAGVRFIRMSNSTDAAGVLRVQGFVYRCTTADCNYDSVGVGSVDLGTATINQPLTLKFDWDPGNDRFNFQRGSEAVKSVSYAGLSDALPPGLAFRQIGTRTRLQNCLAGRTEGWVDARFDNISVNASALP